MSKISFCNLKDAVFDQLEQRNFGRFVSIDLNVDKFRLARILAELELLPKIGILIKESIPMSIAIRILGHLQTSKNQMVVKVCLPGAQHVSS